MSDGAYLDVLTEALRDCLCARLDPTPDRCVRVPGETASWDNCCEGGGQAWVATRTVFPSEQFPIPKTSRFRCGHTMLVTEFELGVVRCSQALTVDGKPPSIERVEQEASRQYADHEAMLGAVMCCFVPEFGEDVPWALGPWTPIGPRGGCVGATLIVQSAVLGCPDCPEPS